MYFSPFHQCIPSFLQARRFQYFWILGDGTWRYWSLPSPFSVQVDLMFPWSPYQVKLSLFRCCHNVDFRNTLYPGVFLRSSKFWWPQLCGKELWPRCVFTLDRSWYRDHFSIIKIHSKKWSKRGFYNHAFCYLSMETHTPQSQTPNWLYTVGLRNTLNYIFDDSNIAHCL